MLEVDGLTSPEGRFNDVSFSVRKGEIFGISGLVGAGRTELVRAIAGADKIQAGSVRLDGKDITPNSPMAAIRNGVVLVPEDRKQQGLVLSHSIQENIAYSNFESVTKFGWVSTARVRFFGTSQYRNVWDKRQRSPER